jgi:hypothetical protein
VSWSNVSPWSGPSVHVDACVPEPPQVVFASLGIDEMELLVSLCQTFFDEQLEDAVMLVHAVEERADVAVPAVERARSNLQSVVAFHVSPPSGTDGCNEQSLSN